MLEEGAVAAHAPNRDRPGLTGGPMRRETIAVHAGFDADPATHAVAVPIYQTAAYSFDSADHGAALFNLEVDGFRYSRISNPTTDVLEQRVAELEGGVGAIALASGQAALYYAFANLADRGGNIVATPATRSTARPTRSCPHCAAPPGDPGPLRCLRPGRRHRAADRRGHQGRLLRERRQSGRQHLRHRGDRRGRPSPWRAADRRQHGAHAGAAAPDRVRRRHRGPLADQVHGRSTAATIRAARWSTLSASSTGGLHAVRFPMFQRAR